MPSWKIFCKKLAYKRKFIYSLTLLLIFFHCSMQNKGCVPAFYYLPQRMRYCFFASIHQSTSWLEPLLSRTNDPPTMIVIVLLCVPLNNYLLRGYNNLIPPSPPPIDVPPPKPPIICMSVIYVHIRKREYASNFECIFCAIGHPSYLYVMRKLLLHTMIWRKAKIKIENGLSEKVIFLFSAACTTVVAAVGRQAPLMLGETTGGFWVELFSSTKVQEGAGRK